MPKEIKLRDLSESDNKMLEKLRQITGKGHNSQAVMKACYLFLQQLEEIDRNAKRISELERVNNRFKISLREYFSAEQELKELIESKH